MLIYNTLLFYMFICELKKNVIRESFAFHPFPFLQATIAATYMTKKFQFQFCETTSPKGGVCSRKLMNDAGRPLGREIMRRRSTGMCGAW